MSGRVTFNPDGYTLEDRRALNQPEEQHDTSDRPGAGNFVTSYTNTHGDVTTTEYDDLGRITHVTRLPGQRTRRRRPTPTIPCGPTTSRR